MKTGSNLAYVNHNRNHKLKISTAPTKAKLREPAYSKALMQNKIVRLGSRSKESGRLTVYGRWRLELRREGGREKRMN